MCVISRLHAQATKAQEVKFLEENSVSDTFSI